MGEPSANALLGKRVVVTRAAEQSASLLAALREKGAVPVLFSVVTFAPPEDPAVLDEAIRHLQQYDWLFLTSQNALRALEERCACLKLPIAEATACVRIAAVGPATAEAAQQAGLKISYVASKHQGVSLAQELAMELKGKRVLLPRSDRANRELVDVLGRLGAHVVEVVAYKTIRPAGGDSTHAEVVLHEGVDAVLFFSPSAVHHFQEVLGAERFRELSQKSAFTAIGPVTEHALREAGVNRIIQAQDTTLASVLDALSEFFSTSAHAGVKRG